MKISAYTVFILFLFSFQATLLYSLSPLGIQPDLCLVIACLVGFRTGQVPGVLVGFGLGFIQDLFSAGPFGLNTFTKAGVGFLAGVFAKNLANRASYAAFVPVMACSVLSAIVFLLWSRMGMGLGEMFYGFFSILLPQAILDGLVAIVANWVIVRWVVEAPSASGTSWDSLR